jgi:hypothetical protein
MELTPIQGPFVRRRLTLDGFLARAAALQAATPTAQAQMRVERCPFADSDAASLLLRFAGMSPLADARPAAASFSPRQPN